jgi:trigger factor
LKIEQKPLDDHQIHFTVEVEKQTLDSARQKAARKIAQRVKIPGFRPGKAPFNVVEKQVGSAAIKDEAIDMVLDEMYPKLIEETGIKPYGPGTLEKVHEDKEPHVFEFRVPLSPEVTLGDYKAIRVPFEEKGVTSEDVDASLKSLREQNSILAPVERPAQEGDIAYVLMGAERQQPDKDGNTTVLPERRYPVVIEKADVDTKNEWPFPGFSRLLLGLKPGEEKAFPHTFDKESEFEELRGVTSDFKLKLEEIKDRQLPELDDAFAQTLGDYQTADALRAEVERQLTQNLKDQQDNEYENKIVDQIVAEAKIKFPPQMLHHEIHHYIEDLEPELASRGMDMDTYLKSRQMDMEKLEEEVSPRVEERLKRSLVIMEVAKQEKVEVPESEVQGLVEERINRLSQMVAPDDLKKLLAKENVQGFVSRVLTEEVIRRSLARMRKIAQGKGDEVEAESVVTEAVATEAPAAEQPAEEAK